MPVHGESLISQVTSTELKDSKTCLRLAMLRSWCWSRFGYSNGEPHLIRIETEAHMGEFPERF